MSSTSAVSIDTVGAPLPNGGVNLTDNGSFTLNAVGAVSRPPRQRFGSEHHNDRRGQFH